MVEGGAGGGSVTAPSGNTCSVLTLPAATPMRISVAPTRTSTQRSFGPSARSLRTWMRSRPADAEAAHALHEPREAGNERDDGEQRQRHLEESAAGSGRGARGGRGKQGGFHDTSSRAT